MNELTADQVQDVGGGLDGVPYHYKSQRVILPPWPVPDTRLEPPDYTTPSKTLPSFGG